MFKQTFIVTLLLFFVFQSISVQAVKELPGVTHKETSPVPLLPLGNANRSSSPGKIIGVTWFDLQHRGSVGRMIGRGQHGTPDTTLIHFSWTYLPQPEYVNRAYMYRSYNINTGQFSPSVPLQSSGEYAGYVGLEVTGDNRAIVGGQNLEDFDLRTDCQFYWDDFPGAGLFSFSGQVPHNLSEYGGPAGQRVLWPKFRYVEGLHDTVLYVVATVTPATSDAPHALYYFRRVGADSDSNAYWDYPPFIVDTVYTMAHDIAADNTGKVALVWTANLPCEGDPCDTCSGYECRQYPLQDNDVYYQVSYDYGAAWQPKVNVTNYRVTEGTEDDFRAGDDLSALIDGDGFLHIVWGARFWSHDAIETGQTELLRGKIFHWSEEIPAIRTVHDFLWDQTTCTGGQWMLNAAKMSVSECNNNLYVLFTQFNDIPAGIDDDCGTSDAPGFPDGGANGDLYVAVSSNSGVNWDAARNITNSRTPGCDSLGGVGGPCDSDNWASMSRFGTQTALLPGDTTTDIVVPGGGVDNGWYLDVQYINDHSAGAIINGEGFWQLADVRWFRMACVEPVVEVRFTMSEDSIHFPVWTHHGQQFDVPLTLTNIGNGDLHYSMNLVEETGPAGWLTVSGFSGVVSAGMNNEETGTVHLNTGGIVNNPGTTTALYGQVIIISDAVTSPDTFFITPLLVTDTLYPPEFDTLSTTCVMLTVSNDGSCGNEGAGRVNLDYVNNGDCDSTADVYLYDASPVIGWINGNDTIVNHAMYGAGFIGQYGFVPVSNNDVYSDGIQNIYTANFLSHDSSIAFEKTWYAPTIADTCPFIIQSLRVWSHDTTEHTGITLGEMFDWDIPSDSGVTNGSGIFAGDNFIWQYGSEYHQDDTGANPACQDNDARFGGVAFLGMFIKAGDWDSAGQILSPYAGYTAANADYVIGGKNGLNVSTLYAKMQDSGFTLYSSGNPDSQLVDLHTVLTYVHNYSLVPLETLIVYSALITVENGDSITLRNYYEQAQQWYCNHVLPSVSLCDHSCCQNRGNADGQSGSGGPVDVSDLTYLIAYLFSGGPIPPCEEEGNVDGVSGPVGPIDVSDLSYLVSFLFQGGTPPPPC